MRFATVCSGIDAPAVAWNPLRWQQMFCSEIEAFPCAVLKHHHPEVPNYGDMLKFEQWPQHSIDVLIAGTPCQSFSVAGMRKGLHDPRGNLTLGFLGVVEKYHPDVLIWENVPGVLSDKTGAFGAFLGGLGELRYGFAYAILDAQWFGVAQRRERVFVVGCAGGDWRRAAQILSIPESLRWHLAPSREKGKSIAPTIEGRAGRSGCNNFATSGGLIPEVAGTLGGVSQKGGFRTTDMDNTGAFVVAHGQSNAEIVSDGSPSLTCNHEAPIVFTCKDSGGDTLNDCSPTLRAGGHDTSHANAGVMPAIAFQTRIARNGRGNMGDKVNALNAQSGRTGKGDAAPCVAIHQNQRAEVTINDTTGSLNKGGGKPGQGYPAVFQNYQVRRLTPIETERLQGFRDDYTRIPWRGKPAEQCPDGPRYKAIGNSMAVPVIRWIGQRIQKICA